MNLIVELEINIFNTYPLKGKSFLANNLFIKIKIVVMNNKLKIALGLLAGGTVLFFGLRRKKEKLKTFTAPDGNTYKENQLYRTYDNKLYKNGKQVHFETPKLQKNNSSSQFAVNNDSTNDYKDVNIPVTYHQKGVRHH